METPTPKKIEAIDPSMMAGIRSQLVSRLHRRKKHLEMELAFWQKEFTESPDNSSAYEMNVRRESIVGTQALIDKLTPTIIVANNGHAGHQN